MDNLKLRKPQDATTKPMEDALRSIESRFRNAFHESRMPKAVIGLDGSIIEANDALCQLVGFSSDEIIGMSWHQFRKPEDKELTDLRVKELTSGLNTSEVIEARVVHRKGLNLVCLVNATAIRNDDDRLLYFLLELQDITERKNTENMLVDSEKHLFDLIEQSPMAYSINDVHGMCLMVNEAWARLWDLPRELPIGRFNVFEDEQMKASGRLPGIIRVLAGETVVFPDTEFDASKVPLTEGKGRRRWISTTAYPVKDSLGTVRNVVFLSLDVTEHKVAESALRDSESRFRLLAENSTDMISRHDAEGVYLYVSPACFSLLGYEPEQLVGTSAFDLIQADDTIVVRAELALLLENQIPRVVRFRILRADGAYIWFESISHVICDQSTGSVEIQCATRDISERIAAQARDREHDRQLFQVTRLATIGTLMSEIGHEINNPNNYIRLNSQNLIALWPDIRAELDSAANVRSDIKFQGIPYKTAVGMIEDLLHGVVEGSRRIESLLLDLRNFVLGDDGAMDQVVDINAAVKSAITIIEDYVRNSTQNFSFLGDHGQPRVKGNQYQLEQVVINLVTNACHALDSPEKPVSVETRIESNGYIAIVVKDGGIGIPDENLKHLMDPFFTTMRDRGGSGLGLAVCSRIIRNHGGTIQFASEVGAGTSVTILLPAMGREV